MKKLLAMLLVLVMVLSMVACANTDKPTTTTKPDASNPTTPGETEPPKKDVYTPAFDQDTYNKESKELYDKILGEFYELYQEAKKAATVSEKWAKMAIAEAKLMESGVMMPIYSSGGNYAISRVVPNTVPYALWGNDEYRFKSVLVATDFLKSEDRAEIKAYWNAHHGDGTYEAWVKDYMASKGYTLNDTYTIAYSSDPKTWDALATSRAADSEAIVMTYDGLMEYDMEGVLKPALAEKYEVSTDGLTYTFYIREGAVWTDSQGRKVADVTADDFVAGMQHMMDAMGGLEYLIQGVIKNANEYINGDVTDFAEVGVKAEGNKVIYTLEAPCTYFMTMLGYGVFAPMSRSYYASQGGKFGAEYDPSAEDYKYGIDPDHIAYNGPFLVKNSTAKNTIVFEQNPTYWNKDAMNIVKNVWLFNDGSDVTKTYTDAVAGTIAGAGLNSSTLETAKKDGNFEKFSYVSSTNATSYMGFLTVNRYAYANVNDGSVGSDQTEAVAKRTIAALQNEHFRRAFIMSVDRGAYNAQSVGEDLKYVSLRNCYTPGNFVALEEDVTVKINGKDTSFKAGTFYGEIMQAQITADDVAIKVWDPTKEDGAGSSDGFDGWFDADNAVAELNKAIAELKEAGVEVSAENPIHMDYPYYSASATYTNKANALKKSVETTLGGAIIVDLIPCVSSTEWYYAGYYTDYGYEANYNMYDLSGWGPDYGDPSTYLDTFLPDYAGYMIKCIGLF